MSALAKTAIARAVNVTRNKFEARTEALLKSEGVTFTYETDKIPYVTQHNYIPDFVATKRDGSKMYIETKGQVGGKIGKEMRAKMKAVKKQHPELDIRFVFYNAHAPITKARNGKTVAQWAESLGFKWAHKEIPYEWIDEMEIIS